MPIAARPLGLDEVATLIGLAIAAALASLLVMAALWFAVVPAASDKFAYVMLGWFLLAHGLFIAFVTEQGLRIRLGPGAASGAHPMKIVLRAAVPLALPLVATAASEWITNDMRWTLLGWAILVVTALPARVVCWLRGEQVGFAAVQSRILPAILALILIELPGWPIQHCSGECWGLMEGGVVAVPLLGAYLFMASTSAALLSVMAVRTVALRAD